MGSLDLSFIIPAKNEEENVALLYQELTAALSKLQKPYELIYIDDGSTDNTFLNLKQLHQKDSRVKVIKLRGNFGKSIALQTGFDNARGQIIFTMDADLQDNPKEISRFLDKLNEGYDMVSGWKKQRHDPISKTFPSKIGNSLTRFLTGVKVHDLNCGFKAYKKRVIENLFLYGELYKYIPVLAEKQNFKVGEIVVSHQPRKFGKSKFGWQRNIKGFLDMLTVVFLTGYLKRPAHFFGTLGIISFFIGFLISLYITYLRIVTGSIQFHYPLLFLAMLTMIIGIQLTTTGLVAEMIVSLNQKESSTKGYIEEILS